MAKQERQIVIRPESERNVQEIYKAKNGRMKEDFYLEELTKLQIELLKLQNWVKATKQKVIIIMEGRDAAGKGGTIKALTSHMNPRGCRVVALNKPTETEKTEWYFKRYISTLPSGGEIVFYDRSWYNRAGVEKVMNFCTQEQYKEFIVQVANLEQMLISSGTMIFKYFLDVGRDEQKRRILRRKTDPLRMWKLSPIDGKSLDLWEQYTEAFEKMFARTHTHICPWTIVNTNDKKRARLNIARDILSKIDYEGKDQTAVCLLPDPSIVWTYSQYQGTHLDPAKEIQKQLKELKEAKEAEKKEKKAQKNATKKQEIAKQESKAESKMAKPKSSKDSKVVTKAKSQNKAKETDQSNTLLSKP
ncbi:polyphosphate kinase 2 [Helicobacter magdeburgensis]|uniref:ADP/GDP-polyphosphate phosphotransferase n=1 Tax=Helicobacter magdeburgensis TaxID=471858 RepID=A0A4U8SX91_9HELI|nr:polyphosphate kinase 2 [Helicobacter magdeburgensis]TLD91574.1 polyphosphate kinase 2 [Helicobacter magdeburgensis]